MTYEVIITPSAFADLEAIARYVAEHDSLNRANALLDKIDKLIGELENSPMRGSHPKELLAIGNKEFRQVLLKPYRIVYHVAGPKVYILLVADGRRDMQSLLQQRLLT